MVKFQPHRNPHFLPLCAFSVHYEYTNNIHIELSRVETFTNLVVFLPSAKVVFNEILSADTHCRAKPTFYHLQSAKAFSVKCYIFANLRNCSPAKVSSYWVYII